MSSRRDAFSLFVWVTYISSFSFVLATRSTRRLKSDRQTLKKKKQSKSARRICQPLPTTGKAHICIPRVGTMSARTALLTLARRAAKAPTRISRRRMSGGGVEEEIGASPPSSCGRGEIDIFRAKCVLPPRGRVAADLDRVVRGTRRRRRRSRTLGDRKPRHVAQHSRCETAVWCGATSTTHARAGLTTSRD